MKKRLLCGLLLLAMLLSLLPVAAYAADGVTEVSTEEKLTAAVNAGGYIKLTANITMNGELTINRPVTLDLNNCELKATAIRIKSDFTATGGTIDVPVFNTSEGGAIKGGTFSGTVFNNNVIYGGTFRGTVRNWAIRTPSVEDFELPKARITGGDFYGEVINGSTYESASYPGMITGGSFHSKVTNTDYGMITGGDFYGAVVSNAERYLLNGISYGCITGGTFYNGLTDNSTGEDSVKTWTVTYYDGINTEPCAIQVVQDNGMASEPIFTDGRTVSGWYTDEACTKAYDFDTLVTKDITLCAKLALSYYLIITDASGKAHTVTSENANDVLGDGSHAVVYTPGYIDAEKTFTTDDWDKALRGETVEGIRLPKLTLNGANLQSIRMEGVYGDDENMKLLSRMLQIELVGDNKVTYDGSRAAILVHRLNISGDGSLSVAAKGEDSKAVSVDWDGGYRQNGGTVTLSDSAYGIYGAGSALFEFAAGKLTVSSSKYALYCELDDSHFKITSDTTTFYFGSSEETKFELKAPFTRQHISDQLLAAVKEDKLDTDDDGPKILYAQLTSNHKVSFETDGGKEVDEQIVAWGETVEKPENPTRRGYTFEGWYLDGSAFNFNTPVTKDMTLTAKWTKNGASGGSTVRTESPNRKADTTLIFDDVRRTDWFYDDIAYVYKHGLMSGTSTYRFSPDAPTTRAMIATMLWRLENEPVVNFAMRFADVSPDQWYGEAVRWAAANGIVNGYSETAFGPDDNITREQLAAMLYRYAQYQKADVSVGEDTNILSYDDAFDVSGYAMAAMQWACGAGVMQGAGGKLLPAAEATRAQTAAMLHRFCEDVLK